jgi:RHS repeat-associated protein
VNEKLFYPFGELWTGAAIPNLGMHQTFAQLPDYDPETDQYNTANRHYSPSGRWMSPDPGGLKVVRLDDPQTWNMYAYARNNPTTLTDPSGLEPDPPVGQKATCISAECTKQQSIEGQEGGQVPAQNTANENTPVGNTTEGELAKTMTHEDGSLSTPKKGDPDVLSDAKEALANAIINNAELKKPEQVATPDRSASAQDAQIMKDAVTNRAKGGADPVEGRHYYGTTHNPRVQSRPAGNHLKGAAGRETVYEKFGPFRDSTSRRPTWIVIYNNPGQ